MTDGISPDGEATEAGLTVSDSRTDPPDTAEQVPEHSAGELVGLTTSQRFALSVELQQAALENPGSWLDEVDPAYQWSEGDAAPDWAVTRRWLSGPDGAVVGWVQNPAYRPSPSALGWPQPHDAADEAAQLAACGYRTQDEVVLRLALSRVAVLLAPDGALLTVLAEDGDPAVPVFTAAHHLAAMGPFRADLVEAADLVSMLDGEQRILLNPTAAVPTMIEARTLWEAVAAVVSTPEEEAHWQGSESAQQPAPAADDAAASAEANGVMAPEQTAVGDQLPESDDLVAPPHVVATTMSANPVSPLPSVREDAEAPPPSALLAAADGLLVGRVAESAAEDAGASGHDAFAEAADESAGRKGAKETVPLDPADQVFKAIMGE